MQLSISLLSRQVYRLMSFLKANIYIFLLLFFVIATRIPYLLDQAIAFSFDHGKDSLAIMHMILLRSPKLIGPWTSIPGLYFGPGWYYLLAPAYLIGSFNPISAVYVMLLLLLIQIILAYKYFGKLTALIMATAPFWIMISVSAWNPFPMTLLTLIILIILELIKKNKKLAVNPSMILGLASSLGFHFSAAYAIFYPMAIIGMLIYLRPQVSKKAISAGMLGFLAPFIPQIIFELRHSFVQTHAILDFFSNKGESSLTSLNFLNVFRNIYGELLLSFLPEFKGLNQQLTQVLGLFALLTIGIFGFLIVIKKKAFQSIKYYFLLIIFFIVIPSIGFTFLHFNVWYVYAMMPLVVIIVAKIVNQSNYQFKIFFSLLLLMTPIFSLIDYYTVQKSKLESSRAFLPIKKQTLEIIRQKAENKPFASYHFVPDIYDFSYQYLYFVDSYQGLVLPTEFAYAPNVTPYIVQKNDLLSLYSSKKNEPQIIFFIVESSLNQELLDTWWNQQQYFKIEEEIKISDDIKLYVAQP